MDYGRRKIGSIHLFFVALQDIFVCRDRTTFRSLVKIMPGPHLLSSSEVSCHRLNCMATKNSAEATGASDRATLEIREETRFSWC